MAFEVVNTSVPAGLVPDQAGFCDVLRTAGVPEGICSMLGPLSRYRTDLADDSSMFAIRCIRFGGSTWGVVSCVSPCGPDYTGRPNRIAHHLVVPPSELGSVSPALLVGSYPFRLVLDGTPRVLTDPPDLACARRSQAAWSVAGLLGWDRLIRIKLRAAQSRVLLLLPADVCARDLLSDLLAPNPLEEQWRVGLATSCDAESAWNDGVRLRVLAGELSSAGSACEPWPGEQVVDLRIRPPAPKVAEPDGPDSRSASLPVERKGSLGAKVPSLRTPPTTQPVADTIEFRLVDPPDPVVEVVVEPDTEPRGPSGVSAGHQGRAWTWLCGCAAAGAACGVLVAFLLSKLARAGGPQ